jgi:hypothetical protein
VKRRDSFLTVGIGAALAALIWWTDDWWAALVPVAIVATIAVPPALRRLRRSNRRIKPR